MITCDSEKKRMFDAIDKFETKDSGKREEFITGSRRDTRDGKGRYDLIPVEPMVRLAGLYERGAVKYGDKNWEKGQPLSRYFDSMERHLYKSKGLEFDEDHITAVVWNAFAIIETVKKIDRGLLPNTLDDIGWINERNRQMAVRTEGPYESPSMERDKLTMPLPIAMSKAGVVEDMERGERTETDGRGDARSIRPELVDSGKAKGIPYEPEL